MPSSPLATREIGRHAVRSELARIAFDKFCLTGFEQVTFSDLAGAAGVSRESVVRSLRAMQEAGLVTTSRGRTCVLDLAEVRRWAEE